MFYESLEDATMGSYPRLAAWLQYINRLPRRACCAWQATPQEYTAGRGDVSFGGFDALLRGHVHVEGETNDLALVGRSLAHPTVIGCAEFYKRPLCVAVVVCIVVVVLIGVAFVVVVCVVAVSLVLPLLLLRMMSLLH